MKMGDPLLSIYLLFLSYGLHFPPVDSHPSLLSLSCYFQLSHCSLSFHCFYLPLIFRYTNSRASMVGISTATPISMPDLLLSSLLSTCL